MRREMRGNDRVKKNKKEKRKMKVLEERSKWQNGSKIKVNGRVIKNGHMKGQAVKKKTKRTHSKEKEVRTYFQKVKNGLSMDYVM